MGGDGVGGGACCELGFDAKSGDVSQKELGVQEVEGWGHIGHRTKMLLVSMQKAAGGKGVARTSLQGH